MRETRKIERQWTCARYLRSQIIRICLSLLFQKEHLFLRIKSLKPLNHGWQRLVSDAKNTFGKLIRCDMLMLYKVTLDNGLRNICSPTFFTMVMEAKDSVQMSWSDFQKATLNFLGKAQRSGDFSDVTLACDDGGEMVPAHKIVLSAGSSFFEAAFQRIGKIQSSNPLL